MDPEERAGEKTKCEVRVVRLLGIFARWRIGFRTVTGSLPFRVSWIFLSIEILDHVEKSMTGICPIVVILSNDERLRW